MSQKNHLIAQTISSPALPKRMLIGAVIGLMLISAFLISAGEGKPEWGHFWMIKPLLMVPFAGAMGGAFYNFMDQASKQGLNKAVAIILSVFVFIVGLWIGSVLGLNGTYWD